MKLFDSYTNQLQTLDDDQITIYNCGPTVYNHIHIGNARPLISMDVLYRYLLTKNKNVKYVLNITDIDDKIINYALENNLKELDVSETYFQAYLKIKKQLNTLPMFNPKVSEHMDEIINYIENLLAKDKAYYVNQDIYFDTSSVENYGQLSKIKIDENINGKRVLNVENKRNPNDFILWKITNKGIVWNSKLGSGRPGWHTECSCLINKYLGQQISIHGGGMDLKFPHHENENAQNNALYNKNLAKIWLHFGLVNIENEKMSKSLNNFILMKDLLEKYSYQAIRWFFYQTKYSQPLNFSDETLKQCEHDIKKIQEVLIRIRNKLCLNDVSLEINKLSNFDKFDNEIVNDLNLANCVKVIFDLLKEANILLKQNDFHQLVNVFEKLNYCLSIFGIEFTNLHTSENIALLKKWSQLVTDKDYEQADQVRAILIKIGLL
ncbi:cysteine--tRNA ligase [Ureaplasma sp. ES3154-GEN]|uniref:cysteine--tRNA ligase n=1 Tax=Ureaplasma sp. ES3154-GEN TaxID=2984844 RepID=UPI0021E946FD|nr:cysteine--tRNA ligase [Ureaplasma sp. ES3154-GEN]MCV3743778.1 cysteine--tRNA ligase [Ureaplasma sp. ES3154-GEN]